MPSPCFDARGKAAIIDTVASYGDCPAGPFDRIPMKHFWRPEEVAALCVFVRPKLASYVTGRYMRIDGGGLKTDG